MNEREHIETVDTDIEIERLLSKNYPGYKRRRMMEHIATTGPLIAMEFNRFGSPFGIEFLGRRDPEDRPAIRVLDPEC